MYRKISDYGIVGNLHTVALIGLDGSIDWLCLPHIDSPSVFAALLDDQQGGRFAVAPVAGFDSVAEYLPDTNILRTRFRTSTGVMQVTDFMPVLNAGGQACEEARPELYRCVEVTQGSINVKLVFAPRFDYARAATTIESKDGAIIAYSDGERLTLRATRALKLQADHCQVQWTLSDGECIWLHLGYNVSPATALDVTTAEAALRATAEYWRSWLEKRETGRSLQLGHYQSMVKRSALVLKLLYYEPSGAIAAAATTSLPEQIGGERNWDYRFTWVRDTSFTLQALFNLGHLSETQGYLRWIAGLLAEHGAEQMQIMYGLRGEKDLTEQELTHLEGYKRSRPVRIGNGAARQKQLDIYGEIMDAALKLSDYVGKIDTQLWSLLHDICEYAASHWREKDCGIWEVRGEPRHFVYSKVMCWVALDRGLTIARRYGFPANRKRWEKTKAEIKQEVLARGWSEKKRCFVQHYETDAFDASNLLIPLLGFLPFDDPRVVSTVEATHRELAHGDLLYRYRAEDGLSGDEGTFLLCTFWLIDCLVGLGRLDEAEILLRRMERLANHVGLYAEEYDVRWGEALGNFPQAFTHIGFINSVLRLRAAKGCLFERIEQAPGPAPPTWRGLLGRRIVLNDGEAPPDRPASTLVRELKQAMNVLRGAFFSTAEGRVAYEEMRHSQSYQDYVVLSRALRLMDPKTLVTRGEQLAFWINLYNILVIHGVIALSIKDSVKEVRNFFRRVQYQVGDMHFTPDDIEHGILRGNRRPPKSLCRLFGDNDKRGRLSIDRLDPRIHFTLVCASSSCPPIEVYTPENLEKELTVAAETFLNAGGVMIDRSRQRVTLSRIFKWYRTDFGRSTAEVLQFIASMLYQEEDRQYLQRHREKLGIEYQDYDWRLNRY
jgi:GH15 family glucan-1,4-alpha-glucosidase